MREAFLQQQLFARLVDSVPNRCLYQLNRFGTVIGSSVTLLLMILREMRVFLNLLIALSVKASLWASLSLLELIDAYPWELLPLGNSIVLAKKNPKHCLYDHPYCK